MIRIKPAITCFTTLLLVTVAPHVFPAQAHAAAVVVTPASIPGNYAGTITLNISGLASGQSVVVEKFLDANGNGVIDSGEELWQRFTVTDGQGFFIAGQRDLNVPGDEDLTQDGKIRTVLNVRALSEINQVSAKFVYRVSPVSGGFTPVTAPFVVTAASFPQGVTGKVSSGGSGVAGAFVFLAQPNGGPIVATVADNNGHFTLNSAPGSYQLLAVKRGLLFDFSTAPIVVINSGGFIAQDLSMLPAGTRTISGRLTDADSGAGIAGVQVFASAGGGNGNNGLSALVLTDASGNFNVPVSTAESDWNLDFSGKDAALLGYLALNGQNADTSGGNVANLGVEWTKVNALIYGTLKDDSNNPLPGIEIYADDSNNQYQNFGFTDADGKYAVGVTGGDFDVAPNSDDPALVGYVVQDQSVTVDNGAAVQVNLVAQAANAHLRGQVQDDTGTPVPNVSVYACPQGNGSCPSATTGVDGSFDIAVIGGMWYLSVDSSGLAQLGLIGSDLSVTVADGQTLAGLMLVALHPTAQISGTVHDSNGDPISGLDVYSYATINGNQYSTDEQTDENGNFSLPAVNGDWGVGLDCSGLQALGFICAQNQSVTVNNNNPVVNFVVQGGQCAGDCGGNHQVTVDESVTLVNIALGNAESLACPSGIPTGADVDVILIVESVNHERNNCQ